MAAFATTRPAPFGAITAYAFVQGFTSVAERMQAWNDARRTRAALSNLSDWELADIGLSRADIDRIARGGRL